ncbi:MAG: response regulator [Candidatus Puniceispirillaceae bacterium]
MNGAASLPSIIVADDDKSVRLVISQALKKQGYQVQTTATAAGMWDLALSKPGALLITDVGFPDGDALDMLPRLQARQPNLKVIVMSARANLLTAVQSQQRGVLDYLPKPFELKQLIETTHKAVTQSSVTAHTIAAPEVPQNLYAPLLGRSSVMQEVYKSLAWLSTQIVPVLIEAEPGSEKALVAKALHDMSVFHESPYVMFNCKQILAQDHAESLLGPGGAIAQSDEGTLFINNIEELDETAQLQFVAALEAQLKQPETWPKRLLIGTSIDLKQQVANDAFREDLYFALSVAPLKLPALRERRQDIPALVDYYCDHAGQEFGVKRAFSMSAIASLQEYDWPGNLKELAFVIRKLFMSAKGEQIEAEDVLTIIKGEEKNRPSETSQSLSQAADHHIRDYFAVLGDALPEVGLYDRMMEQVERPLIIRTLHLTKGNQIKAAHILGLNRNTLRKKIDMLGISKTKSDYKNA